MPTREKRITIVIYPETLKSVEGMADRTGMSKGAITRRALELGIKEMIEFGFEGAKFEQLNTEAIAKNL